MPDIAPSIRLSRGSGTALLKKVIQNAVGVVRRHANERSLPRHVRLEIRTDRIGPNSIDPGSEKVLRAAVQWLCDAQDHSLSRDGGVARDFNLLSGWASSYPETTGYIVPTFLDLANMSIAAGCRERARTMLDWLVRIQMPEGAFQGGKIDSTPVKPVAFNTGQILLGLAAGQAHFGTYADPMHRAAQWLVDIQDPDGAWRRGASPFAGPGDKTYDTHIAWGLLEAARIASNAGYAEAALANVRWTLTQQAPNGWIDNCCLDDPRRPLTHTLGYSLRGILEAHRYSGEPAFLRAARLTADGMLPALRADGFLPGRLDRTWSPAVEWSCLTGSAQVSWCWLYLFETTGDQRYLDAAQSANGFLRRTVKMEGPAGVYGGVKGSFPVDGDYVRLGFPNWGAKFLIDALLLERRITASFAIEHGGDRHRGP